MDNRLTLKRLLVLLLALVSSSLAAKETPEQKLKAFLSKATTLESHFVQVQVDEKGNTGKRSEGRFYLQRPGKFRWNYEKPHHQEIVANGGKVWFFDRDLEQVTVKHLNSAIGSTPALLLTGEVPLETNFKIESQSDEEGIALMKLIPKSEEGGFKYIQIGLENNVLVGMELSDNFGQLTRIYFDQVKTGVKLGADTFNFKAPPGADVFEDP
jgi:outer membrane lipoprotein carrier protein